MKDFIRTFQTAKERKAVLMENPFINLWIATEYHVSHYELIKDFRDHTFNLNNQQPCQKTTTQQTR